MNQKSKIYSEVLLGYLIKKEKKLINDLIEKIILNGERFLLKEILGEVLKKIDKMKNIEKGKLVLTFKENEKIAINYLNKYLNSKKEIEKVIVDPNLILGGKFISDNYELDFSLRNILWKISNF
jgi:F0F1-type ATP synthase delta subunit